jgi:hypothetical protein
MRDLRLSIEDFGRVMLPSVRAFTYVFVLIIYVIRRDFNLEANTEIDSMSYDELVKMLEGEEKEGLANGQ